MRSVGSTLAIVTLLLICRGRRRVMSSSRGKRLTRHTHTHTECYWFMTNLIDIGFISFSGLYSVLERPHCVQYIIWQATMITIKCPVVEVNQNKRGEGMEGVRSLRVLKKGCKVSIRFHIGEQKKNEQKNHFLKTKWPDTGLPSTILSKYIVPLK